MDVSQHFQALLIALASSTDNFLVGLSVGLTQKPLSFKVLWGIAVCNAAGCLLATSGGSWGADNFMEESSANGIAALAFAYLAWKEYVEGGVGDVKSNKTTSSSSSSSPVEEKQNQRKVSLDLALPMTLNNLAGGVAAGVIGVSPLWNFAYALVMSVLTMWVGYQLGNVFSGIRQHTSVLIAYGPIVIYLVLSFQSLREAAWL